MESNGTDSDPCHPLVVWTRLEFGRYAGKTLPQVIFADPDWFFWACEDGVLSQRHPAAEVKSAYRRARAIRIPRKGRRVEYLVDAPTGRFGCLRLVRIDRPIDNESEAVAVSLSRIDLSVPRSLAPYDKRGCALLIRQVKGLLFGDDRFAMTAKRADAFFSDPANFLRF